MCFPGTQDILDFFSKWGPAHRQNTTPNASGHNCYIVIFIHKPLPLVADI